jgi:hypothetical protein
MPSVKKKRLHTGDFVNVRSFPEIAETLDKTGALEGLPFLAEMLKYCGRTFTVRRRVNKLIQEGVGASMRRIKNVVLLDGTICDGQAHDHCQRACFPLWKTAWLETADAKLESVQGEAATPAETASEDGEALLPLRKGCQVTELIKATKPLSLWHPLRQYWDVTSRIYSPKEYLAYILGGIYRKTLKRLIDKLARSKPVPPNPTPTKRLDLTAGDLVEVKFAAEIRATLNAEGKSRGLFFMPGMWDYCGRRLRVLQPIERMMSEKTGEMRALSQTVILEGVTCNGKAHGGCQRGCYVFWKDTWLRRVNESPQNSQA